MPPEPPALSFLLTMEVSVLLYLNLKDGFVIFQPLEEATLSELKTVLKSFLSQGQVLKLEVKVSFQLFLICFLGLFEIYYGYKKVLVKNQI